jgi:thiol-disulfide isomerase/thioredoxin
MRRILLAILMASIVLASGCVQEPPSADGSPVNGDGGTNPGTLPGNDTVPPADIEPLTPIQIQSDRSLTPQECSERGLGDRVIFVYSSTCPACAMTKPLLFEAASEAGKTVEEINLVTDRQKLDEIGILPYYIPTTIIDCEVLVGAKQKFEFRDIMERM